MSGTSIASPYISGAHALYMQAKKSKVHGDVIRGNFKNTVTISKNYRSKLLSPNSLYLQPSRITIKNYGSYVETYTLHYAAAGALNSYNKDNTFPLPTPAIENDYATISVSQSKVSVLAGKNSNITFNFQEPMQGQPIPTVFRAHHRRAFVQRHLTRVGSRMLNFVIRIYDAKIKIFVGLANTPNIGPAFGWSGRQRYKDVNGNSGYHTWLWNGEVFRTENRTLMPMRVRGGSYDIVVAAQRKLTSGRYPRDLEVYVLNTTEIV
ncbi:hypothetical protein BGX28_007844 [Mortierella sp. GBA30]|nr:hypothetical protein BGX28_007844 [Mortierella sp. GBA30]